MSAVEDAAVPAVRGDDRLDDVVTDCRRDDPADAPLQLTLADWAKHPDWARCGGAHALGSQQPGISQVPSRHGAPSSTASTTSTSAVRALVRCASAISYRV